MITINSRIDTAPLAIIYDAALVESERDCSDDPMQILQSSCKLLPEGKDFKAHVHLPVKRDTVGTQEAWIIVSGEIKVSLYDIDDSLLDTFRLGPGMCLVMFRGGHGMCTMTPTLLYEFKNGPYFGVEQDKRWIHHGVSAIVEQETL